MKNEILDCWEKYKGFFDLENKDFSEIRTLFALIIFLLILCILYKKHKGIFDLENKEYSNVHRVGVATIISILLPFSIITINYYFCLIDKEMLKVNGIWTLFTLIISAPIAFIIWHFRDVNARQQIENQRKDINLKEFQKIAEWVSGAHLVEDKIVKKTTLTSTQNSAGGTVVQEEPTEHSKEFSQPSEQTAMQTFSKRDGAVGLQIAAVYNLLPFYRGEYGEHFKKPAFNLLRTAWLSMQNSELVAMQKNQEEGVDITSNILKLRENANSPLGSALTQVLLDGNGKYLSENNEQLKSLSLPAMDFSIVGKIDNVDLSGVNLSHANLGMADLRTANLLKAKLVGVNLSDTLLKEDCLLTAKDITGSIIFTSQVKHKANAKTLRDRGLIILENSDPDNLTRVKHINIKSKKNTRNYFSYNFDDAINLERTKTENSNWEFEFITE